MNKTISLTLRAGPEHDRKRVDQVLAQALPDYSRSRIQTWIKGDQVRLNAHTCQPADRIAENDLIEVRATVEPETEVKAEPISLDILHEDEDILIINKPPGLVMHPGAGNNQGTLQNALLYFDSNLAEVPRSGIVHRLDKDTSGLVVVAHNLVSHNHLVRAMQERAIKREYQAVVCGVMTSGGKVVAPITRHPVDRKRMAVAGTGARGRPAVTHYRLIRQFRAHTHIRVMLETGRTHQIRVHMQYLGYPLLGDPVYGRRMAVPKGASEDLRETIRKFRRQALHACKLALNHPSSGELMQWEVEPPPDYRELIRVLSEDASHAAG